MVTDALAEVWTWLQATIIGAIPPLPDSAKAILGDMAGSIQDVVARVQVLSPVIPFEVLSVCWNVLIGAILFALLVELARMVASYLTFGGGAT